MHSEVKSHAVMAALERDLRTQLQSGHDLSALKTIVELLSRKMNRSHLLD